MHYSRLLRPVSGSLRTQPSFTDHYARDVTKVSRGWTLEGGAFDVTVTIDSNEWEDDISDDVTVTRHNAVVFVLFVVVLPLVSLLVKLFNCASRRWWWRPTDLR